MDRWGNRIVVVAGACSGIGCAIVRDLLKHNLIVVGLDWKMEQLEKFKHTLPANVQTRFHCMKIDWQCENDILKAFDWIEKTLGGCDILINNLCMFHQGELATMDTKCMREMLDINIMATFICNREAIRSMKGRNFAGQLIMINGMDGHRVPNMMEMGMSHNMWCPIKYCMTAMNEVLRQELHQMGTKINATNISPSWVEKEMLTEMQTQVKKHMMCLKPEDICQAVLYILSTPQNVVVNELMLRAMGDTL